VGIRNCYNRLKKGPVCEGRFFLVKFIMRVLAYIAVK
jgi:hypothetical protein